MNAGGIWGNILVPQSALDALAKKITGTLGHYPTNE